MTDKIHSVCVYCGSSNRVDEKFKQAARALGKILAAEGLHLVYGGGHVGLMGIVADTVLDGGGKVTGVIPSHIADKEVAHGGLSELRIVDTMHERKQIMVDLSDAFIILPGGLGTMDEFFEIFTWWQLGLHDKPIIIVNIDGYWDPLLLLIDSIITHKFGRESDREYICVISEVDGIIEALENAPREKVSPKTKWI